MSSLERKLKQQELIEEYLASPACELFKRIKVYELGYRIFLTNFDEWQRSIDAKCPNDPMELIQMMQEGSWVEPYLVEVTRTLHNFVASALTLVDTTRVVYRELYEPKGASKNDFQEFSYNVLRSLPRYSAEDSLWLTTSFTPVPATTARAGTITRIDNSIIRSTF